MVKETEAAEAINGYIKQDCSLQLRGNNKPENFTPLAILRIHEVKPLASLEVTTMSHYPFLLITGALILMADANFLKEEISGDVDWSS